MKFTISALAAVSLFAFAPANAATVIFGTTAASTTTTASQNITSGGVTASFTGGVYAGTVAAMNGVGANVSLTARDVQRSSTGLGVAGDGSQSNQVDSSGANELLQVTFSTLGTNYRITQVILGRIDANDTFALFGGNNGVYTRLGFTGPLAGSGGVAGGIPVTTTQIGGSGDNRVYRLDFTYGGGFDSFRFGTNLEESDGFSLQSLSVAAVPEPSAWALMILGFGLTGAALRRRAGVAGATRGALRFS